MPVRPVRHLDLLVVPLNALPLPDDLKGELVARGLCDEAGRAGRLQVVEGGFQALVLDRPNRTVLYANRQGGFRVRCPQTNDIITGPFVRVLERWRQGGDDQLICDACGEDHALSGLTYQPPAAFGAGAVVFLDVGTARLTEEGREALKTLVGPFTMVGRRR